MVFFKSRLYDMKSFLARVSLARSGFVVCVREVLVGNLLEEIVFILLPLSLSHLPDAAISRERDTHTQAEIGSKHLKSGPSLSLCRPSKSNSFAARTAW